MVESDSGFKQIIKLFKKHYSDKLFYVKLKFAAFDKVVVNWNETKAMKYYIFDFT